VESTLIILRNPERNAGLNSKFDFHQFVLSIVEVIDIY